MKGYTFTDGQLTAACELHVDNLRQLITWKAAIPYQRGGGRGRVRLWTLDHVYRISMTASIFNAGFSLKMAHTLAYLLPQDDPMYFCNPDWSDRFGWFDPKKSRVEPNDRDWYIHVVNGRFLYMYEGLTDLDIYRKDKHGRQLTYYGKLNRDHTVFKSQRDFAHHYAPVDASVDDIDPTFSELPKWYADCMPKWVRPGTSTPEIDPSSLAWEFDPSLDEELANDLFTRPKSKLSINLTLALRIAARRVLNLPVDYPS
jgi:hypothetical protein